MKAMMFIFLSLLAIGPAIAQPQLAVLRTSFSTGIDPTVAEPITEKIIESIVKSGAYTVLDRLNIDKVLSEKEFQITSTVVSQAEMRRAGEYLGADYVLLASISRVGSTFILSAKVVDVTSGAIAIQVSEERKGSIDVLLEAASAIGDRVAKTDRATASAGASAAATGAALGGETPVGEAETAMNSIFGVRTLLDKRVFMKEAGAMEVAAQASSLGVEERTKLYKSYRMAFPIGYSFLNILPSFGSWIQGDATGALIACALFAAGPVVGTTIYLIEPVDSYGYTTSYTIGYATLASLGLADVFGIVRPFVYGKKYNRQLSRSLLIVDADPPRGTRAVYVDGAAPHSPAMPGINLTLLRLEL